MANAVSVHDLLERNKLYSSEHIPFPTLREIASGNNTLGIVMVSCVDSRVQPDKFFKLKPQDAFVLKTVAGHPQQCLQDILVLDALAPLKQLVIMHHTDCGATMVTDDGIRARLLERLPDHKAKIDAMKFGSISSLEESLKEDVAWVKSNPYIRKELAENTIGLLYDLKTGVVSQLDGGENGSLGHSEL